MIEDLLNELIDMNVSNADFSTKYNILLKMLVIWIVSNYKNLNK